MSTVAHPLRAGSRPGWLSTGWSVVVGAFVTVVVLAVPAIAVSWSGFVDSGGSGNRRPGVITGPFYPGGVWAIATDVVVAALVVGVAAVAVQRALARNTGFHLRRLDALLAIGLTGLWPLLYVRPIRLSTGLAFLIAVVIVRWRATPDQVDESWPVKPLLALAAVAAAVLGSYAMFHPIRIASGGGSAGFGAGRSDYQMISIRNSGFAKVTLLGLSIPAGVGPPGLSLASLRPVGGTTVPGRSSLWVILKRPGCPPSVVTLHYRLFGNTMSEPLVLPCLVPSPPVAVR